MQDKGSWLWKEMRKDQYPKILNMDGDTYVKHTEQRKINAEHKQPKQCGNVKGRQIFER